jgi:hypothetical protein
VLTSIFDVDSLKASRLNPTNAPLTEAEFLSIVTADQIPGAATLFRSHNMRRMFQHVVCLNCFRSHSATDDSSSGLSHMNEHACLVDIADETNKLIYLIWYLI